MIFFLYDILSKPTTYVYSPKKYQIPCPKKQIYTQQSCKRPLHTDPPSPPYISFIFILGLIAGYHIST